MKVLSIDWDYFVEEDPALDWGHRENSLFLEAVWKMRRTRAKFKNNQCVEDADGRPVMEILDLKQLCPFRGDPG